METLIRSVSICTVCLCPPKRVTRLILVKSWRTNCNTMWTECIWWNICLKFGFHCHDGRDGGWKWWTVRKKQENWEYKSLLRFQLSVMFKIVTLELTRICRMQLSYKSIQFSVVCSKSSLKSNFKTRILCLSTSLVTYNYANLNTLLN